LPQKFSAANFTFLATWGADRLLDPHGIAVEKAGTVLVVDSGNDRWGPKAWILHL